MVTAIEYTDYLTAIDIPTLVVDLSANIGPRGPKGDTGDTGPAGPNGPISVLTDVADGTVPTAGHYLRGDGTAFSNSAIVKADLPALGPTDVGAAASVHQHSGADITSGTVAVARLGNGTPSGSTLLDGSGAWRALAAGDLPAHSASLITSGTLATSILASGGSSANFFRGDGTFTNVLTSGITVGAAINLGNTATVTAANNQIYGGAGGPAVNAPTGSTFQMQTNGTTRANISLNGLIFPASATAMAAANISIGSGAHSTMHLNVPTGGLFLFCEAATSGVVISSASKYLQFQAAGGVLGAAGNAAHTYLAGGNSAANFAGAWLRAYGNSSVSSPGQMILAPGNVAGAKISILDTAGTERLAVTSSAVTCAAPLVTPTATPASASATGVAGQWAWDTNYIYICTATNTWRRVAHATW